MLERLAGIQEPSRRHRHRSTDPPGHRRPGTTRSQDDAEAAPAPSSPTPWA